MNKTFNARPFTVNTDIKNNDRYFEQGNWKGLCTDKNYLNVDQETFEDCKNVYMSSDLLLKSRPSFKCKNDTSGKYIKKWVFEDAIFGLTERGSLNQLYPVNILYGLSNPKIFQKEGIIFVIHDTGILYYDVNEQQLKNAKDLIYVPTTDVYTNDIKSELDAESENVLIDSKKIVRNYDSFDKIDPYQFETDSIKLNIGAESYDVDYEPMTNKVLVDKYTSVSDLYYDKYSLKPLIFVSKKGNAIRCQRNGLDVLVYDIYYTSDFITWTFIDRISNATSPPNISEDGSLVYYLSDEKIYTKSLLSINNVLEYPEWTILFTLPDFDNLGDLNDVNRNVEYQRNLTCNVKLVNSNMYAAVYGVNLDKQVSIGESYNAYKDIKVVIVKNGEIRYNSTLTIFDDEHRTNNNRHFEYKHFYLSGSPIDFEFEFYNGVLNELVYVTILAKTYRIFDATTTGDDGLAAETPFIDSTPNSIQLIDVALQNANVTAVITKINCNLDFHLDRASLTLLSNSVNNDERLSDIWTSPSVFFTQDTYGSPISGNSRLYLNYHYVRVPDSGERNKREAIDGHDNTPIPGVISKETKEFITKTKYYDSVLNVDNSISLLHSAVTPIAYVGKKFYYIYDRNIYVNELKDDGLIKLEYVIGTDSYTSICFDHNCELNEEYISKGNNLYISQNVYDEDGNFKLYFPKITNEQFNKSITNLHPVSQNQVAIFFKDEIWYVEKTDAGYRYYKSKLQVGLNEGSDVLTSQDGQHVIFSSTRGLVYMSYQELVQSTEQTLTYLSDAIYDEYKEFNKKPVKLFLNDFWLYCYHDDEKLFYVFDVRNNSWWAWEYYYPILNILKIDDELEFLADTVDVSNSLKLDYSYNNYYDEIFVLKNNDTLLVTNEIDWYVKSQKLHLGTLNYTKNVISITINNVEQENVIENVSFNLSIKNYRHVSSDRYLDAKNLVYQVDTLRTYVKRCNSRKVNEFQYTLSNDLNTAIQLPLSVHSVIIKYTISGQVR